jgi:hypothetical protein
MPISPADARQASEIKDNVRAGRLNGANGPGQPGNPGFQVYENAGGHVAQILAPAARNQTYYEYQLGSAAVPAAGFGAGAGVHGVRRLVLLVSPVPHFDILEFCHVAIVPPDPPAHGPAAPRAFRLPISAAYPALMTLRTKETEGAVVNPPYGPLAQLAHNLLAPVPPQEFRTLPCTLTGTPHNREHLPAGQSNVTIYFKGSRRTTYQIHHAYYSDDHYESFTKI